MQHHGILKHGYEAGIRSKSKALRLGFGVATLVTDRCAQGLSALPQPSRDQPRSSSHIIQILLLVATMPATIIRFLLEASGPWKHMDYRTFKNAGSPLSLTMPLSASTYGGKEQHGSSCRLDTVFGTNEKSNIYIIFQHCWYLSSFRLAWCWSWGSAWLIEGCAARIGLVVLESTSLTGGNSHVPRLT